MKKKQLLATLAISTLALTQAGFVSADEANPVDATAPVVVTEPTQPVDPIVTPAPTEPAVTEPVVTEPVVTEPVVPTDPVITEPTEPVVTEPIQTEPTEPVVTEPAPVKETEAPVTEEETTPEIPANPKPPTTEQANQEGQNQVGTTSSVTGQVVQNVTQASPVVTNTGATIVSTQDGQVVLSDGTLAAPEAIGAETNADKTITVTKADGTKATLPHTGEVTTGLLTFLGTMALGLAGFLYKKQHA